MPPGPPPTPNARPDPLEARRDGGIVVWQYFPESPRCLKRLAEPFDHPAWTVRAGRRSTRCYRRQDHWRMLFGLG